MEVSRRRNSKEVVVYVQGVMGKKKLLFQFEYGQKKEMRCVLLSDVCSKE